MALLFLSTTSRNDKSLAPEKDKWIEVTMVPQQNTRIVESNKGKETKEAAPNAYLGEKTRTVDREVVSRTQPDLNDSFSAKPKRAQKAATAKREVTQKEVVPLSKLGIPLFKAEDLVKKKDKGPQQAEDTREFADMTQGDGKFLRQEYIKGLKDADETALNTREYVFFSYFQRIRERLDQAWRPLLRDHIEKIYRKGRQIASDREHTTRTLVVLNLQGEIVRVQVLEESGTQDLDSAAIQAFNKAGPFPNPPKGLVESDGTIRIRWDFVLRT